MRPRSPAATTIAGWVLVSAVAGFAIGGLWALVSPRVGLMMSGSEVVRVDAQPEEYFGSDLTLGAMLACAGFGCSLWWLMKIRRRPVATVVGLSLGGVVAGIIAAAVGQILTTIGTQPPVGGELGVAGLSLRSPALLMWWPAWAAIVIGLTLVWFGGDLGDSPTEATSDPFSASETH